MLQRSPLRVLWSKIFSRLRSCVCGQAACLPMHRKAVYTPGVASY
jgi:hypothetical protein